MKPVVIRETDPASVEVRFSNSEIRHEFTTDVIADVNALGSWIRGLELFESAAPFSLLQALTFLPRQLSAPASESVTEPLFTYDENANAAFLYLPYGSPEDIRRDLRGNRSLLNPSYSIEDVSAILGLDESKSLVLIRFRIPSTERMKDFIRLMANPPT